MAGAASMIPLAGQNNYPMERLGHSDQSGGPQLRVVTRGYFEAIGMSIRDGRSLSNADARGGAQAIVISEALARRWWGTASPLGDHIVLGRSRGKDLGEVAEPPREIIGVVADTKTEFLGEPPRPTAYVLYEQTLWYTGGLNWVARGDKASQLGPSLRDIVAELDSRQRVERLQPLDELVSSKTADSRFDAWIFGFFAALALIVSSAGVYGLLAFLVRSQRREIGTRLALGADRSLVLALVLRRGLTLCLFGFVVGLGGAAAAGRIISGRLFGVQPLDFPTYVGVGAALLIVGVAASYFPARLAANVDPAIALGVD